MTVREHLARKSKFNTTPDLVVIPGLGEWWNKEIKNIPGELLDCKVERYTDGTDEYFWELTLYLEETNNG